MRIPPALRPGDTIVAFAGSSPFDATLAWRGLAWMRSRYEVRFERDAFSRHGLFAGTDERRRAELDAALRDPDVRALVAFRGGYGLSRIAHELDWAAFAHAPRWIVGFSDVTALHVEAARVGVASLHAPMIASLGRADGLARSQLIAGLEAPEAPLRFEGLRPLVGGVAEGPLFGGNLTLLHACAAAGRLLAPEGCILLLEDVSERPYRIDRMLTTLRAGGHLARAAGVLLGDFTDCSPGPDGVDVATVLASELSALRIPVLAAAPVGHGPRNHPVVLGRRWRVDADAGRAEAV